mmetsp:Transcript_152641/g.489520  ORF Transcript_152641/g.489520 Transcript_152641/m.489520 type:complete len:105 (+) Transcript_152641:133-447(+)
MPNDLQSQKDAVMASANVHLGVLALKSGACVESVSHFEVAHQDPGTITAVFLQADPWPYDASQLPDTIRYFVKCYATCLHRVGRDGDARSLWERAAAAGVVRDS